MLTYTETLRRVANLLEDRQPAPNEWGGHDYPAASGLLIRTIAEDSPRGGAAQITLIVLSGDDLDDAIDGRPSYPVAESGMIGRVSPIALAAHVAALLDCPIAEAIP